MNIKLTHKLIKDMCGLVSFKKGDSFHRAKKVSIETVSSNRCEAIVKGNEEFHVTIETTGNRELQTNCSCPKLASYTRDCQHVAAVLLALYDAQQNGTILLDTPSTLTDGLLTLFSDQPLKSSEQLHFEKRKLLAAEFLIEPVSLAKGQTLFGVKIRVNQTVIANIREFLKKVERGSRYSVSHFFQYDPSQHCFQKEADAVLWQLIQVIGDEKVYLDNLPVKAAENQKEETLLIPPSSWDRLFPFLERTSFVTLEVDSQLYNGVRYSNEPLALQFTFSEGTSKEYQLKIHGLKHLTVLLPYHLVIAGGNLVKLKSDDCKRLAELKQMLAVSGTNQIPISQEQLPFFLEKVVPGLRKLGEVSIEAAIAELMLIKTPLKAKLFLDRVSNRLLAGVEFHYENNVIYPLETGNQRLAPHLFRDLEKEEIILELLEESGFARTDGGFFMHNEELEYQFLYHAVPHLEKLVQIYATSAVKIRIFRGNTPPQIRVKVKKERTNWLEFKFEMDGIPETQIREILEALEEKRKYYRLPNGGLLSLETKGFAEIGQFLQAVPNRLEELEKGLNVPIVRGLQLIDVGEGKQTFTFEESFREFIDRLRNPGSLQFPLPKSLEPILRDYQKQGFTWMKTLASFGFGGILADDMGLGKTLQSITFIVSELAEIRKKKHPTLIVCPSSLTYNWLSELNKFSPELQAVIVDGQKKERLKKLKHLPDVDVVITSYPILRKDISEFEKQMFHTVFFDEAQAFKNPFTQTARSVKKIQADHRFALTGTPVENSREELWSIFHVVFPELFLGLKEYSYLTSEAIARRTQLFLLRRMKDEVLSELPEKIESLERVDLLPDQKKLYAAYLAKLKHDTLKHLDKDTLRKNRIKILAGLTRLRQICCHPGLFVDGYQGTSAKFEQLFQILEEAKHSGRRVLIFSQFTKMLELIGRRLALEGLPFFYLDGQTPSEERIEICNRFNSGERDLFLISLKAGGTGLNLTGADTVILYDLWWNPAVEAQAADRAHRIGQTNVVQVIKLVARGTIEEKINELQDKKRHLIEEIIAPEGNKATGLTDEDIREILMI
ncbi:SNF2 helicase associated domain-containing protein [Anaerobacillus sp. CMMVII]|uniref:DEAD/DEAH box helicase n=1 Tax=Anaerobacillus sp. CMMVII TaxID=2755588 RepID=UPI0021B70670|nr:DEAD/DEAH box helicase [Anaerobacillus sp. CMMVII]MCT8136868.1 SNF2 helicase associated domain-containing protein [Anaerobacillus sp. CMMVII]